MFSQIVISGQADSERPATELDIKLGPVIVVFDMWGQRCETVFDTTSELDPLTWIGRMVEKGWMLPLEIFRPNDGLILYTEDDLHKKFQEE